jgi:hypothetical protein
VVAALTFVHDHCPIYQVGLGLVAKSVAQKTILLVCIDPQPVGINPRVGRSKKTKLGGTREGAGEGARLAIDTVSIGTPSIKGQHAVIVVVRDIKCIIRANGDSSRAVKGPICRITVTKAENDNKSSMTNELHVVELQHYSPDKPPSKGLLVVELNMSGCPMTKVAAKEKEGPARLYPRTRLFPINNQSAPLHTRLVALLHTHALGVLVCCVQSN